MKKTGFLFLFCIFIFLLFFYLVKFGITTLSNIFKETNTSLNSQCIAETTCQDCNIIYISADSFNAGHMGKLGYHRNTTPFLDSFFAKGFIFSRFFSTSQLTPVTQMSIQTSMYPSSLGINGFYPQLPSGNFMLAQLLKKEGYANYAIHTSPEYSDTPERKSFSLGFDRYVYLEPRKTPKLSTIENEVDKMISKKFFLWLSMGTIHWPFDDTINKIFIDKNYQGLFKDKKLNANLFLGIYKNKLYQNENGDIKYKQGLAVLDNDIQYVIDNYDNGIKDFDDFFRSFIGILQKRNLLKKTIIILTSEHGEDLHLHGFLSHNDIYDNQIHVPLLIYTPKNTVGEIKDTLASSVDISPTLLELIGRSPHPQSQGKSLLPFICNQNPPSKQVIFTERLPLWEMVIYDNETITDMLKEYKMDIKNLVFDSAIRTNDYKYIQRSSKPYLEKLWFWNVFIDKTPDFPDEELYNLQIDPDEQTDISQNPKYKNVKEELKKKLSAWQVKYRQKLDDKGNQKPFFQEYF